jgi:CRISPR system Cascade subunit CasD
MRDYLVFQLYGPLASWGDIAVGETRPSALTPTKSVILGLVAASLGLKRPDTIHYEGDDQRTLRERVECEAHHAKLAEGYGMAVKVEALGLPLSDYHTAEVPKGAGYATRRDELQEVHEQKRAGNFKGTILSRREYRQDIFCAVALWARLDAPRPLDELRRSLLEPRFTVYLGRKACPLALPMHPTVIRDADYLEDALAETSLNKTFANLEATGSGNWSNLLRHFEVAQPFLLWDDDAETRLVGEQMITRRDVPLSRQRWQFSLRNEHRAYLSQGKSR